MSQEKQKPQNQDSAPEPVTVKSIESVPIVVKGVDSAENTFAIAITFSDDKTALV